MSGFDNELKFALFRIDKGENPKRPDYRGTITIGGIEYTLSGWIAQVKGGRMVGQDYIRGDAKIAERKGESAARSQAPAPRPVSKPTAPDEDVPF